MSVFFVHDATRGIITPLDRKYHVRDIPPASELQETGAIHQKVDDQSNYQQRNAAQQYQSIEDETDKALGTVSQYMSQSVLSLPMSESLEAAWDLMRRHAIHHLAITNEQGLLAGLLTERAIVEHLIQHNKSSPIQIKLSAFCADNIISTLPSANLVDLAQGLLEMDLSGIPVTESGKVVGMITRSDLIKVLLANKHLLART